ncbi:MAG: alpha-N-arabinofuranosidase [Clostridia bacterium]|nr:alpha-N-arabinofuranosidase [Clostridia bacterium]
MRAKLFVEEENRIGQVDRNLFGSFVEHLGRCVYHGIYDPGHSAADAYGFRKDVTDLVKELGISVIRYPGGNLVSSYRWEDGVGPLEERPVRADPAWRSVERNEVGVNEFCRWCRGAGIEPMMTLNLSTRGIQAAADLLEYCNLPSGTYLSDLRTKHGFREPHNIRYWCLGNEMDGPWQVGHKTAEEYGRLATGTAQALRMYDPDLKLVSCGSSHTFMDTFPEWEAVTLSHTYDEVDYISLHQYFDNEDGDTADFLAKSLETDRFIRTVTAVCDYVKAKKRGRKDIMLSFDEWNLWYHSKRRDDDTMKNAPWTVAPRLLEDIYTFEDALVAGCMLITFLRHADRVKMACMAQLVNVIAPIMAEEEGVCRQTTFYPFLLVSRYGRGSSLNAFQVSPRYDSRHYSDVPYLESAVTLDEERGEMTLFAVNRSLTGSLTTDLFIRDCEDFVPVEHIVLESGDLQAVNTVQNPAAVVPARRSGSVSDLGGGHFEIDLHRASWNVLRFRRR